MICFSQQASTFAARYCSCPNLHARVSLFDKDNKPIVHLGDDPGWRAQVLGNNFAMREA